MLTFLPRLLAIILGKWSVMFRNGNRIPIGIWYMIGNILPENGIIFNEYPIEQQKSIDNIWFTEPCTFGGIFMSFLHGLHKLLLPLNVQTSQVFNCTYYMPEIINPEKYFYQNNVQMVPTSDSRIWWRINKSSGKKMYIWMHESHPDSPFEEWMCIFPHLTRPRIIINLFILSSIIVFTCIVTRGLILVLILCENVWYYVQYLLIKRKLSI